MATIPNHGRVIDDETYEALQNLKTVLSNKLPLEKTTLDFHSNTEVRIPKEWKANVKEILLTQSQIQQKIREMATTISADYAGESIICVGMLKGAFMFASDLIRNLEVPYNLDFISASSYTGTESTGSIFLKRDMDVDPRGKHILVIEDLCDTGTTIQWVVKHLQSKAPKSVKVACLCEKMGRRSADVKIDYCGFRCPDEFIVGYGMDYNDSYRCLPFVGVLKSEVYARK
eukprot:237773_1